MAFDITRFGSDSSNVKSILDGVRYYRYFNKDNNTLTTPGYFPADLGLNVGDRIAVVPSTKTNADELYIVTSVANRVVTVTQVDTDGLVDSVNGKTGAVVLDATDVGAIPQYSTMPTASADNEGQVVQFVGATDTYTNGYFYKCVSDGLNPATYSWTQLDVQPANSGGGGIEWTGSWDMPANFVGYATPRFEFASLPDGRYRFYYQFLTGGTEDNVFATAPLTMCVYFTLKTIGNVRYVNGAANRVINGDFTTNLYAGVPLTSHPVIKLGSINGGDCIWSDNWVLWKTNIAQFADGVAIDNCYRWSDVENLDTGDKITPTIAVGENDAQPAGTVTEYTGYCTEGDWVNIPEPAFMSNQFFSLTDQSYGLEMYNTTASGGWYVNQREYRVLITADTTGDTFDAIMYYNNANGGVPTYTIKKATGIFANSIIGYSATKSNCVVEFNFAAGVNADVQVNLAKVGARQGVPGMNITEDPTDLVELNKEQQGLYLGTGFDATKTQTLKNVNGVLTWVDD